jgi:formylglycine-generating enzyme required for sulfatase activity
MTEMEYEKVCRGPIFPEAGEYAWGTTNITEANTPLNDGAANETCTEVAGAGGGLCNYNFATANPSGPFRVGFAATASSSRFSSGSTYYGVMEMSGNVWEHTVGVTATGLTFTGNLGDGELSLTPLPGNANVTAWPSQSAATNSTTSAPGASLKGGGWNNGTANLRVSDRTYFNYDDGSRYNTIGGRGVRQY